MQISNSCIAFKIDKNGFFNKYEPGTHKQILQGIPLESMQAESTHVLLIDILVRGCNLQNVRQG